MGRRGQKRQKSRQWAQRQRDDAFVRRAGKEGYRSRAVFKIEELDRRHRLIRPGMRVLDLGAAPGSWSQYIAAQAGEASKIVALDRLAIEPIEGVVSVQGDFRESAVRQNLLELLGGSPADLVVSDMSPDLTGIRVTDQANMAYLLGELVSGMDSLLVPGGNLLVKVFEGEMSANVRNSLLARFGSVSGHKPGASRSRSREFYLLARTHRP